MFVGDADTKRRVGLVDSGARCARDGLEALRPCKEAVGACKEDPNVWLSRISGEFSLSDNDGGIGKCSRLDVVTPGRAFSLVGSGIEPIVVCQEERLGSAVANGSFLELGEMIPEPCPKPAAVERRLGRPERRFVTFDSALDVRCSCLLDLFDPRIAARDRFRFGE